MKHESKQTLKIYTDRLRDDKTQEINETFDPSIMELAEKDVVFSEQILVTGEAYLAKDWLIVRLNIETKARLSCAVCNDPFSFDIHVRELMHEEPLENLRDKSFDILPLIRENILLEIPFYPQCGITTCKNRQEIEKYLKKEGDTKADPKSAPGHNPFKDIL